MGQIGKKGKSMEILRKLNIYWILPVLFLCVLLVISCSKTGQDTPVIIGINSWTGYDPFILAEQKNLFAKNNVNVKIKRFGSAQDEMRAMQEGALQGAGFTMDEAVTLNESGYPVKIVLIPNLPPNRNKPL